MKKKERRLGTTVGESCNRQQGVWKITSIFIKSHERAEDFHVMIVPRSNFTMDTTNASGKKD